MPFTPGAKIVITQNPDSQLTTFGSYETDFDSNDPLDGVVFPLQPIKDNIHVVYYPNATVTYQYSLGSGWQVLGVTYVRPYKVYSALITQSGSDQPTIVVLENTLDPSITILKNALTAGALQISQSNGSFVSGKTFVSIGNVISSITTPYTIFSQIFTTNIINMKITTLGGVGTNGVWRDTPLEIRVYN